MTLCIRHWLLGLALAFAALAHSTPELGPLKNWRLRPAELRAGENALVLQPLLQGKSATWTTHLESGTWFSLRFSEDKPKPVLLTYSTSPAADAVLEVSHNSPDGKTGTWVALDTTRTGKFLNKIDITPQSRAWYRVRFLRSKPGALKVWNLGLYAPAPGGRNDYWLAVGASIQNQSMRQARFQPLVRKTFPDYDPILFNLAVSGWGTTELLRNLPAILGAHPYATYVLIHIGGNNMTWARPYDGGAATLRRELPEILTEVKRAGKIPILARLSYRQYRDPLPVPPEENGSWPYVQNIYDPLIREFCPAFFDWDKGQGLVDFYTWFKENPEELSSDGIHLNARGEMSWGRIWVEEAGGVVYGKQPVAGILGRRVYSRMGDRKTHLVMSGISGPASMRILDTRGRLVAQVMGRDTPKREKVLEWNFRNDKGRRAAVGVYEYEIRVDGRLLKGRLVLTP